MGEPLQLYRGKPLAVKLRPSTAAPPLVVPNLNAIDPRSRKTATTQRLSGAAAQKTCSLSKSDISCCLPLGEEGCRKRRKVMTSNEVEQKEGANTGGGGEGVSRREE